MREGILKAVRGPHGGYVLSREQHRLTAHDILRAARTVDDESEEPICGSALLVQAVGSILIGRSKIAQGDEVISWSTK